MHVLDQTPMQLCQLRPAFPGKAQMAFRSLVGQHQQVLGDDVAGVFEIDGEVGQFDALARFRRRHLAAVHLGEVELDLGVGAIDLLVDLADAGDLLARAGGEEAPSPAAP